METIDTELVFKYIYEVQCNRIAILVCLLEK